MEKNNVENDIGKEINRIISEINNLINVKAKKLEVGGKNKFGFDEKLIPLISYLPLKGAVYSYNFVINSDDFWQATRKQKLGCLLYYKALFKEAWKDFLKD